MTTKQKTPLTLGQKIAIGVAVGAVGVTGIAILIWQLTKSDSSSGDDSGGGGGNTPADIDASPVLIGIVPSLSNAIGGIIPLATVLPSIDIFWDWQSEYTQSLYGVPEGPDVYKKFVPMAWGMGDVLKKELVTYLQKAKPKFTMLYNEPDLAGSVIGMINNQAVATSDGFWIDYSNFPFGNAIQGGITSVDEAKDGPTSFIDIATKLTSDSKKCKDTVEGIKVTTPAMALSADVERGCAGFKTMTAGLTGGCNTSQTENNLIETKVQTGTAAAVPIKLCGTCGWQHDPTEVAAACSGLPTADTELNGIQAYVDGGVCKTDGCSGKGSGCGCNGWLSLAKEMAPSEQNWWEQMDIINFHSYEKYAHRVKLKILEYLFIYKEDVVKRDATGKISKAGKVLWLTEVASLYSQADLDKNSWQDLQGHFLAQLLWQETTNPEDTTNCSSFTKYGVPDKLPGLRTIATFEYIGFTGSWYSHGFDAITWFGASQFPGFPADCTSEPTASLLDSSVWNDDGKTNQIFDVLTGKKKSVTLK
jgi:hypothetical protein